MKWWFTLFCVINLFTSGPLATKCLSTCCEAGLFVCYIHAIIDFFVLWYNVPNFDSGTAKFLSTILLAAEGSEILFNLSSELPKFLLSVKLLTFTFGAFLNSL